MERPTVQDVLDGVASLWATRSTCSRLNVGAVIHTSAGVVLSTGYNGTLAGLDHCRHDIEPEKPCAFAVHAESNAVAFAARMGVALDGMALTVTHAPCVQCAKLIHQSGIVRVRYLANYRSDEGLDLLRTVGCQLEGAA